MKSVSVEDISMDRVFSKCLQYPISRLLTILLISSASLLGFKNIVNAEPYELTLPSSYVLAPGATVDIPARFTNMGTETLQFVTIVGSVARCDQLTIIGSGLTVFSVAHFDPGLPLNIANWIGDPPTGANIEFFGLSLAPGESLDFVFAQLVASNTAPIGFVTFMDFALAVSPDFCSTEGEQHNFFSDQLRAPFSIGNETILGQPVTVRGDTNGGSTVFPLQIVLIDIKPGSSANEINPRSNAPIPVAILTTDAFNAITVDPTTIRFGTTGTEATPMQFSPEDVNGDGRPDLILQFRTRGTNIVCGDTSASLTGQTFGEEDIEGTDAIQTVGCK